MYPFAGQLGPVDAAKEQLHRAQESISARRSEIAELEKQRATSPLSQVEQQKKEKEIENLHEVIAQLEKTVKQQQDTIYTQSKTIQNPRPQQSHFHTPNKHHRGGYQYSTGRRVNFSNHHGNAGAITPKPSRDLPSVYDTPAPAPRVPVLQSSAQNCPRSLQASRTTPADDEVGKTNTQEWNSPLPLLPNQQLISNFQRISLLNSASNNQSVQQTNQQPSETPRHGAPQNRNQLTNSAAQGASELFRTVFDLAEQYCFVHTNTPKAHLDAQLPAPLKERILKAGQPLNAFPLMNSAQTRYLLVCKVVVEWIVKNILHQEIFEGLNPYLDRKIVEIRENIYASTPPELRHHIEIRIASAYQKIVAHPNYANHVRYLACKKSNELWRIVKPLMHEKKQSDWCDLLVLMQKSHELAEKILTSPYQYKFETITAGSTFNKSEMINRTPSMQHLTPENLEARGLSIALDLTPHISLRKRTATGFVNTTTILPGLVMVKFPNS